MKHYLQRLQPRSPAGLVPSEKIVILVLTDAGAHGATTDELNAAFDALLRRRVPRNPEDPKPHTTVYAAVMRAKRKLRAYFGANPPQEPLVWALRDPQRGVVYHTDPDDAPALLAAAGVAP